MKTTYKEALAKLKAKQNKGNWIAVDTGYNQRLLLPFVQGTALIAAMENAIKLDGWGDDLKIMSDVSDVLTCKLMSALEVEQLQIAQLLGIPLLEVKEMYKQKESEQTPP